MNAKICVLGSYVCQMSVVLPHVPKPGETIVASQFDMGQGGKGNNVAISCRRLGADVVLIERVGKDTFGNMAFDIYQQEKIDTTYVYATDGVPSGIGLVYIQTNGENTAAYFPGANQCLSAEDVYRAEETIRQANILYIQLEIPDEPILAALELAEKYGLRTVLNPAPARDMPANLLKRIDVLTPNQVEAFDLIGEEYQENLTMQDIESIGRKLIELGPREVFITLGSKGAFYINDTDQTIFHPCLPVDVVDTVGAGDAFNAALCASIANQLSTEESLFRACVNGALTTTKIGVINALPSYLEVNEYIETYRNTSKDMQ